MCLQLYTKQYYCIYLFIPASLAVAPTVANAEVSVVVSADFRKANATYSPTATYTISGNLTLVFDCDSQPPEWTPAPPQVKRMKCYT